MTVSFDMAGDGQRVLEILVVWKERKLIELGFRRKKSKLPSLPDLDRTINERSDRVTTACLRDLNRFTEFSQTWIVQLIKGMILHSRDKTMMNVY